MRATLILLAAALAAGTVGARARELAPQTLTEAESAFLTVPGAERARVSNAAVPPSRCVRGARRSWRGSGWARRRLHSLAWAAPWRHWR